MSFWQSLMAAYYVLVATITWAVVSGERERRAAVEFACGIAFVVVPPFAALALSGFWRVRW